jgi:hypothetical protein
MTETYTFSVTIDPELPIAQREALLTALQQRSVALHEAEPRVLGSGLVTFLAVMGGVGAVAGTVKTVAEAANEVIDLGEKINEWRSKSREAGVEPNVRLERDSKPVLDLATASDAAVLAWFLDQAPPA